MAGVNQNFVAKEIDETVPSRAAGESCTIALLPKGARFPAPLLRTNCSSAFVADSEFAAFSLIRLCSESEYFSADLHRTA